jgi:hypothetical protein
MTEAARVVERLVTITGSLTSEPDAGHVNSW